MDGEMTEIVLGLAALVLLILISVVVILVMRYLRAADRGFGQPRTLDWPTTDWDALSDVDYWAELAADKPLSTTAQPAGQPSSIRPSVPGSAKERRLLPPGDHDPLTSPAFPGTVQQAAPKPSARPRGGERPDR